jgi:trehalose 6-phosphate synthase
MLKNSDSVEREPWTAQRLSRMLAATSGGHRVIVVANREPFRHERTTTGRIEVIRSASGLVTALEPIVEACAGVWVAHGAGTADRQVVDAYDGVDVPELEPKYRLRRVWLSEHEHHGYYEGFANEGLWPLCHRVDVRPIFRLCDFAMYKIANARFAAAVCDEAGSSEPVVFVQDYHLALAPRIIRGRLPRSTVITFWHVPWPDLTTFEACPCGADLLEGLLGSTVVGFQTVDDCDHFLDAVECLPGADVDREHQTVTFEGRRTLVRAYPISLEHPSRCLRSAPPIDACRTVIRRRLGLRVGTRLIVGVDRLDYTKGLIEKCLALERLLEREPAWRGRVVLAQIAEPSRTSLQAYRELAARTSQVVSRINARFADGDYRPIIWLEAHHEPEDIFQFFRAASICYVGSLHDGMNLVAKEFVAARSDERGVLVLSRHSGAARQLDRAVLADPHDLDDTADRLSEALLMGDLEQSRRMRAMRSVVATFNAYWWAGLMLEDAAQARASEGERPAVARVQADPLSL